MSASHLSRAARALGEASVWIGQATAALWVLPEATAPDELGNATQDALSELDAAASLVRGVQRWADTKARRLGDPQVASDAQAQPEPPTTPPGTDPASSAGPGPLPPVLSQGEQQELAQLTAAVAQGVEHPQDRRRLAELVDLAMADMDAVRTLLLSHQEWGG